MALKVGEGTFRFVDAEPVGFGELEAFGVGSVFAVVVVDGLELKRVEETKED